MARAKFIKETQYEYLVRVTSQLHTNYCILWPFSVNRAGYGILEMPDGSTAIAHRVAYKLSSGEWPEPCGMHMCDNPGCVNALHVVPGTNAENSQDMVTKKRSAFGTKNGAHLFNEDIVRAIRAETGMTQRQIAKKYNTTQANISLIITRQHWKHVE